MPTNAYHFLDQWQVRGDLQEVSEILGAAGDYPRWWPSTYLKVTTEIRGDENQVGQSGKILAQGWLPYRIRFDYQVTESRKPHGFSLKASGDLSGTGIWKLKQDGEWVKLSYDWTVIADKPILRLLSPILKPLFRSNHNWTMKMGEKSLQRELDLRHCRDAVAAFHLQPPPGPLSYSPWTWIKKLGRRLAGLQVVTRTEVCRPLEEVFSFVTQVENDLKWQPEIQEVQVISPGPLGKGSLFREVRKTAGQAFDWEMEITEFIPNRLIWIRSIRGQFPYQGYRLFETSSKGTRITEWSQVVLPFYLWPFKHAIAWISKRSVIQAYAKLSEILEKPN